MSSAERFFYTMPDEIPTAREVFRVAPNENLFPVDATVQVVTDDDHLLCFRIEKKGPMQPDYLVTLISSEPPVTTHVPYLKEVYVKGDRIVQGREFTLDSAMPILLGRTTFTALQMFSNIEEAVIPQIDRSN